MSLPNVCVTAPAEFNVTLAAPTVTAAARLSVPPVCRIRSLPVVVIPGVDETVPTIRAFASTRMSEPLMSAATVPMSFCRSRVNVPVPARYSSPAVMMELAASLTPGALIATRAVPAEMSSPAPAPMTIPVPVVPLPVTRPMLPFAVVSPDTPQTVPTVKPSPSTSVSELPVPMIKAATVANWLPPWPRFTLSNAVTPKFVAVMTPPD